MLQPIYFLAALWICTCLVVIVQSETPSQSQVIILDPTNLPVLTKNDYWFIKFYAPWCTHCQRLAPTWDLLAQSNVDEKVHVAKINCQDFGDACSKFNIRGYPTLLFMHNGVVVSDYQKSRNLEDLQSFVKTMTAPATPFDGNSVNQITTTNFDTETFSFAEQYLILFCSSNDLDCEQIWLPLWKEKIASQFKNTFVHVKYINCADESSKELCSKRFNLPETEQHFPVIKLLYGPHIYSWKANDVEMVSKLAADKTANLEIIKVKFVQDVVQFATEGYKSTTPLARSVLEVQEHSFLGTIQNILNNPTALVALLVLVFLFVISMVAVLYCCLEDRIADDYFKND